MPRGAHGLVRVRLVVLVILFASPAVLTDQFSSYEYYADTNLKCTNLTRVVSWKTDTCINTVYAAFFHDYQQDTCVGTQVRSSSYYISNGGAGFAATTSGAGASATNNCPTTNAGVTYASGCQAITAAGANFVPQCLSGEYSFQTPNDVKDFVEFRYYAPASGCSSSQYVGSTFYKKDVCFFEPSALRNQNVGIGGGATGFMRFSADQSGTFGQYICTTGACTVCPTRVEFPTQCTDSTGQFSDFVGMVQMGNTGKLQGVVLGVSSAVIVLIALMLVGCKYRDSKSVPAITMREHGGGEACAAGVACGFLCCISGVCIMAMKTKARMRLGWGYGAGVALIVAGIANMAVGAPCRDTNDILIVVVGAVVFNMGLFAFYFASEYGRRVPSAVDPNAPPPEPDTPPNYDVAMGAMPHASSQGYDQSSWTDGASYIAATVPVEPRTLDGWLRDQSVPEEKIGRGLSWKDMAQLSKGDCQRAWGVMKGAALYERYRRLPDWAKE